MKHFSLFLVAMSTTFMPENKLSIPVHQKTDGLSREQFDYAITRVEKIYRPIIQRNGGNLVINRNWESPTVNAGTLRELGSRNWIVNMYGGFARHPRITVDGLSLVLCHEIGHHVGGAPKKSDHQWSWSSAEGQADYFATLKCLRKVFASENNEIVIGKLKVPAVVRRSCDFAFKRKKDSALCQRTSLAGLSVASVNADGRRLAMPQFEIADQILVAKTIENHPEPQCRLETYFQGSLCQISPTFPLSQYNEVSGTCHSALGFNMGTRPGCWFREK